MINLKNNRGVTLIVLSVTVFIIGIVLTIITFSSRNSIKIRDLNNMYADIKVLDDKISIYYLDYNALPIGEKISNEQLNNIINEASKNPNNYKDGNLVDFYIIDTTKLQNTTLNNSNSGEYAINEQSHSVYYLKGIEVDGVIYHTIPRDYSNVDLEKLQK